MGTKREIQTKNIELFFKLINTAKVIYMSNTDLTIFAMGYFDLLEAFSEKMPFVKNLAQKRQDTILKINSTNPKDLHQVKDLFVKLQQKAREQLKSVMNVVEAGGTGNLPVMTMRGEYEVYADLENDSFVTVFVPDKISGELTLENELKLLEIVIGSILVDYNKKPNQLKICAKNDCLNFFFQFSKVSKYCSTKCSNAAAQKAFKNRQR